MDEIEYKLNTKNSVLIVNAIDKLISTIKSKCKPVERQKFVIENEELKFLRDKCLSEDYLVSLTACQGLLALVELGVLEIGHTMSTVVTLLPSAHNYSAIISTMAGLLILDLKSRLVPGQPYKCQFTLKSPKHPFITVLEKTKEVEDEVLTQMHALCTHPDYIVSSNSLELLWSVFFWLTCNPRCITSTKPWQLLLSLPQTTAQSDLLLTCISCQQLSSRPQWERAVGAYAALTEAAVLRGHRERVLALLPLLARAANRAAPLGCDSRGCYALMERGFAPDAGELRFAAGLALALLADNLPTTSALYLHELFNLCLNIISKHDNSSISLSSFAALSLQWLHLPSYLTAPALKVASKILDTHRTAHRTETVLCMPNLKANKTFQHFLYTDCKLYVTFKLNETWERIRDDPIKINVWCDALESVDDVMKLELVTFLYGVVMHSRKDAWMEEIVLRSLRILIGLVEVKKDLCVQLLPILLYRIANDESSSIKLACLKALPLMAKTKENVPTIVSFLNKLKSNKGAPLSFIIMLYTRLAEVQVRCFPYLKEVLAEVGGVRADDLKWETDISKAVAVRRICELRPSSQGVELVAVISSLLNRSGGGGGAAVAASCVAALGALWRGAAVSPPSTWRVLEPKLGRDMRPAVAISVCGLLSLVPALRASTPEYERLTRDAARRLWLYVAGGDSAALVEAACDALAEYRLQDYTLGDVPEIYRRTVKLPASYCKTPADAARKPEEVLDYIPCEVWPEVFRYSNQLALEGVARLATRLVEREVRALRSGAYQRPPGALDHLPPASVLRGLAACFLKQASRPSHEYPDGVLLAILRTLTAEYARPLPPLDVSCLWEAQRRGALWRPGCLRLAAAQLPAHAQAGAGAGAARRLIDDYLAAIQPGVSEEQDILLLFELLPLLCRGMPPDALRGPLEACLAHAHVHPAEVGVGGDRPLFERQLQLVGACLNCDRIHEANRTMLSQILEGYFTVLTVEHAAWPAYVTACKSLATDYLERMTSPSAWWETTGEMLRASAAMRAALAGGEPGAEGGGEPGAAGGGDEANLVWLNEVVDAHAGHVAEQEHSLWCVVRALRAGGAGQGARGWLLQLLARSQLAFADCEDESAKLYYYEVFATAAIVFSGHWSLEPDGLAALRRRDWRLDALPAALAALLTRPGWSEHTPQVVEWLCHTCERIVDAATVRCCRRALLALRHEPALAERSLWVRLASQLGRDKMSLDD